MFSLKSNKICSVWPSYVCVCVCLVERERERGVNLKYGEKLNKITQQDSRFIITSNR